MKKLFVILAFSCAAVACGGGGSTENKGEAKTDAPAPVEETKSPEVTKGLELVANSDCLTCHKIRETLIGPAYLSVSERYPNATDQQVDSLALKIVKGGAGKWGQVAMTPHPQISKEDATTMVKYILSLKR
ncbi:MAG TPA: c-type cytochrome [Segetibacter sp.]